MTNFKDELEKSGYIVYTSRGVSMLPLIRQGRDIIVIEKGVPPYKKYDAVLFIRENGAYVLHRITKVLNNSSYYIIGDNCTSGETVNEDQIIGLLKEVRRGKRIIRSDSLWYAVYARIVSLCLPWRVLASHIKTVGRSIYRKLWIVVKN